MTAPSNKKSKPISRASAPNLRRGMGKHANVPVRLEFDQDSSSVTALKTPAPLPPTPGESGEDGWFDQMPTNPSELPDQVPDLGALAGRSDTSVPIWARDQRRGASSDQSRPSKRPSRPRNLGASRSSAPAVHNRSSPSYGLVVLVAAAFLAVGMVLGALMQERLGGVSAACPDPSAHPGTHAAP